MHVVSAVFTLGVIALLAWGLIGGIAHDVRRTWRWARRKMTG